jgi:hypothetical protein
MHAAVCEAGWAAERLMPRHREVLAPFHRGRGREVIRLDWPYAHHERGLHIGGVQKAWDPVDTRSAPYQTVLTAVLANRDRLDGMEAMGQQPHRQEEALAYLNATGHAGYDPRERARERLVELLQHRRPRVGYRTRTAMARDIGTPLEQEGHGPQGHSTLDNGGLHLELRRALEQAGTHWGSELEQSRQLRWQGQWRRADAVAAGLRQAQVARFRPVQVRCRNGETKTCWAFTQVVGRKRYGRKRVVIVHEQADLQDTPRFLLTEARPGESRRVIETWSSRWTSDIFHEFGKQMCGWEAAQVRQAEAVTRHFRVRCVAQALLQSAPASGSETERVACAQGALTIGQKVRTIAREALKHLLPLVEQLLAQGHSCDHILEVLMPA